MGEPHTEAAPAPERLISLVVAVDGRVALMVGHRARWLPQTGYIFVPLDLPAGPAEPGASDAAIVDRLAHYWLGRPAQVASCPWTYGATSAHAIDRVAPVASGAPGPLLSLERMLPVETAGGPGPRRVVVRAYRTTLSGPARPNAASAGILWLAPEALRLAVRGLPLADLLARGDVRAQLIAPPEAPADALAYVPSEYGERYLLRVIAKYGQEAIFPGG